MRGELLTVEDVNSLLIKHRYTPFWDSFIVDIGVDTDFDDIKFNYCTISREYTNNKYKYTIFVDNDLWSGQCYFLEYDDSYIEDVTYSDSNNKKTVVLYSNTKAIKVNFYLNMNGTFSFLNVEWIIETVINPIIYHDEFIYAILKPVKPNTSLNGKTINIVSNMVGDNQPLISDVICSNNRIKVPYIFNNETNLPISVSTITETGYQIYLEKPKYPLYLSRQPIGVLVCNNSLITFNFGFYDSSIGSNFNIDKLFVKSNYPVIYKLIGTDNGTYVLRVYLDLSSNLNLEPVIIDFDYKGSYFDLFNTKFVINDLTFPLVFNNVLFDINVSSEIPIIKVTSNFNIIKNYRITYDFIVFADSLKTIDLNNYKFIIDDGVTVKFKNIRFINGINAFTQDSGSKLIFENCEFSSCTSEFGYGAVLGTINSFNSNTEYEQPSATFINCTFSNNESAILYNGKLEINNCTVEGKINSYNNTFFLYQTDGEAIISNSEFTLISSERIEEDIGLNSCIFTCGENAQINGMNNLDLQNNDINEFFEIPYKNRSFLNIEYLYSAIDDYILMRTDKGYCHSVSDVDYVFKNNFRPERSG